ncbi:aldehyde dehydrogenase [uncultured archaeon]|nr:aldehyde dehydrogenase [uncultured archaeon]
MDIDKFREETLKRLGLGEVNSGIYDGKWAPVEGRETVTSYSPIDGKPIAKVTLARKDDYDETVKKSKSVFEEFRLIPAPKRGQIIAEIGRALREHKEDLGRMVTLEVGKTKSEGEGEIQEMIDIADFAVGLSRQLYGLTIASERPYHRLYEQWIPLGPVAVISAFNFPSAVWSWNAFIAGAAGDTVVWKPSTKAPLTAVAVMKVISGVFEKHGFPPVYSLIVSKGSEGGNWITDDPELRLVSFTGSTRVGKRISEQVSRRLGRSILELGGNNAAIVTAKSDENIALKGVVFGALATAGQRCTSTRRAIVESSIYDNFLGKLKNAYSKIKVGNPSEKGTLVGPLIDAEAIEDFKNTVETAKRQGGKVIYGGKVVENPTVPGGFYVEPTLIEAHSGMDIVKEETFAPILYVLKYTGIEEALRLHNSVPQGLSSALFTNDMREEEAFLSAYGSDCGIANVNTSTAGAEIGGAFGGEKETGGGRESGSDAWKGYMRRQTVTKNWGDDIPLAQDVVFDF